MLRLYGTLARSTHWPTTRLRTIVIRDLVVPHTSNQGHWVRGGSFVEVEFQNTFWHKSSWMQAKVSLTFQVTDLINFSVSPANHWSFGEVGFSAKFALQNPTMSSTTLRWAAGLWLVGLKPWGFVAFLGDDSLLSIRTRASGYKEFLTCNRRLQTAFWCFLGWCGWGGFLELNTHVRCYANAAWDLRLGVHMQCLHHQAKDRVSKLIKKIPCGVTL